MLALAEATLGPLGGVVVGVDEAGDEELGGGESVETGTGGVSGSHVSNWKERLSGRCE